MGKIVIVTGGTSGIGLHTAAYLQSQGCTVYTVSRRPCDDARFRHICADVTQEADVARAVKSVLDEAGRIDILVNNAGFGISGAVEFTEPCHSPAAVGCQFLGHGRHDPRCAAGDAAAGEWADRKSQLRRRSGGHSVPDVLFRLESGHQ